MARVVVVVFAPVVVVPVAVAIDVATFVVAVSSPMEVVHYYMTLGLVVVLGAVVVVVVVDDVAMPIGQWLM